MKVFALIVLAIASASGKGSGPYLPSGWRPTGPAFFLPSEVKPAENPLQDVILAGSEASGSDALREYGPPKVQEITQNLINQGLPDAVTEQTFNVSPLIVVDTAAEVDADVENVEVKTEEASTVASVEAATETILEEKTTASLPVVEIEKIVESLTTEADGVVTTNTNVEVSQVSSEGSVQNVEISQQISEKTETSQSQESTSSNFETSKVEKIVSATSESESDVTEKSGQTEAIVSVTYTNEVSNQAQNIPEIIASLNEEIKNQQAEVNQGVSDQSSLQISSALEQAPEGFLEYGPPGFAEYGPPKSEITPAENKQADVLETNETRRRRFSPKFRSSKKH